MAGVNVQRLAYRLLAGPGHAALRNRALEARGFPPAGPASWLTDRLLFLGTLVRAPFARRYRGGRPPGSLVGAYDPAADDPATRAYRSYYVREYFGEELSFVTRSAVPSPASLAARLRGASWLLAGTCLGLLAFLDLSRRRYRWLAASFLDARAFARALPALEKVYVFALYDRRSYLAVSFLHARTRVTVVPVFQNIPLYRNCRFFHMPIPVVMTSAVSAQEAGYFRDRGEFLASAVTYRPHEFLLDVARAGQDAPSVDIGYFSTGEWARRDGLYQVRDPEIVRSGVLRGNPYDRATTEVLEALAGYARERHRTLVIYPHPFERTLMSEHGIEPPYAALEDGTWVRIDRSDEPNSRLRVREPRVAVSIQSSFIWERIGLGLDRSYVFEFEDPERNPFLREALGPYERNVYRSTTELMARLDEAFGPSASRSLDAPRET